MDEEAAQMGMDASGLKPAPRALPEPPVPRRVTPAKYRQWWCWALAFPLLFAIASIFQVVVLRFVDPPFSAFMLERQLSVWLHGDLRLMRHDWRDLDEIAYTLPMSMVAGEDQRFAVHHGFDFGAIEAAQKHNDRMIARAEKRNRPVTRLRGASTISQQTAKNLFLWQGSSLPSRALRKVGEVWYTVLLETLWPKRRILEVYANVAELGDGYYGAQAAARHFFGEDASALSPAESARLAAVLPGPRLYNPVRPSGYVQNRANWIQRQVGQLGGRTYLENL